MSASMPIKRNQLVLNVFLFRFSVLKRGDTIAVPTRSSGSTTPSGSSSSGIPGFFHVGIYLGNEEVIDYMNDSRVRRMDIRVFTEEGKRTLYRIHYVDANPPQKPRQEIIETAANSFRNQDFGEYNVVTNNCEHFVTFWTFGRRFSYQVANASVFGAI